MTSNRQPSEQQAILKRTVLDAISDDGTRIRWLRCIHAEKTNHIFIEVIVDRKDTHRSNR